MDNMDHGRGFFPGPAFDAHHGGGSALGWVVFALQLVMLAGLAVLLARAFMRPSTRGSGPTPAPVDPLETARFRYARGDLSREEYLQVVRDLGGSGEPSAVD